jgi:lysophospholipid acyltransferase (LPLAT)-like uncharacterized protein
MEAAVYTLLVSTTIRSVISHNASISEFTTDKTSNLRNWHGHFVVIPATMESVFFIYMMKERKQKEWKPMTKE